MTPPSKPRKICHMPYCNRKTHGTYCEKHQAEAKRKKSGWKPKKQKHDWYDLKLWKGDMHQPVGRRGGLRDQHLAKEPYCRKCLEEDGVYKDITGKYAGVVDHIKPWSSGSTTHEQWQLFTDPDNLQSLCKHHHASKTAKESNQ